MSVARQLRSSPIRRAMVLLVLVLPLVLLAIPSHPAVAQSAAVTPVASLAEGSYRDTVMADNPVGYWRLGEASGTTAASETGSNGGTYQGGVTLGRQGVISGDTDTAVSLDGVNDTIRVPSSSGLGPSTGLTLEAWVNPGSLPSSSATIMRKDGQYLLRIMSSGALAFRVWKAGAAREVGTASGLVKVGEWTHVAATWNGSAMLVYVNGVQRAALSVASPIDGGTADLYVGSSLASYDWFSGRLDEAAVYAAALSASRVQTHYAAATAAPPLPDTTPPSVTLVQPSGGSSTTDTTPAYSGQAGDASGDSSAVIVDVYAGSAVTGSPVQTLTATRTGTSWSKDGTTGLAVGTYTAQATQSDDAGNVGRSTANTFTVTASPPSSGYRDEVMTDNPAGYWRLGELSGTTAASQTGTNQGTYSGGVALGYQGALIGDPDTAARFDGVNDTVSVANATSLSPTTGLSLEAWVNLASLPSSSATITRKDGQYLLRITSSGGVIFRLWKGGTAREISTASNLVQVGRWSHVVATWDGSTTAVFVNGVQRASGSVASPIDSTGNALYIGSVWASYDWVAGALDEVAVYRSALSAARVQAHFAWSGTGTGPTVSLESPATGSTMDARPNFGGSAGTASGNAATVTVKVYSGSSAAGVPIQTLSAAVQSAGTFSVRASSPLASGTYSAQAEQTTSGGGVGTSPVRTFTVDASAPPALLAAGDIAGCDTFGDEATAALLDRLPGTVGPLGDLAYQNGTAAEFANCYDPTWGRHKARSMPGIGDHEYLTTGASGYFGYWGAAGGDPSKGYYSYDIGTWHVVVLNSTCSQVGGCGAGSVQEQWLRADLATNPAACTVAVIHEPRFSSGNIHGNSPEMTDFWRALYDSDAELVLSGNDHVYERFAPQTPSGTADPLGGIRQFVVGTGGRSHYGFGPIQPNSEARDATAFGVLKLSLRPGGYDWQFVPEAGKSFTDGGSDTCH